MNVYRIISAITVFTIASFNINALQPLSTRQEIDRRIALDFDKTEKEIIAQIKQYYPDVTTGELRQWEKSKALEYTIINGEKRYFRLAAKNLFRIDAKCRAIKSYQEGRERASRDYIVCQHIREILSDSTKDKILYSPHNWEFYYNINIDNTNLITDGEMIKVWLPYPSNEVKRQQNIATVHQSHDYQIYHNRHTTAFTTNFYNAKSNNRFEIGYRFTSYGEYHGKPEYASDKRIDIDSEELRKNISERPPHIVFSPEIKSLAKRIIGKEQRPYYQARLLFEAMRNLFPWAGAREYSTIDCIPEYVIENKHGDCGQIALLYITLCRYIGIPARWQSGFMLHPGYENLHDWAEIYIPELGWIPVDPSFGVQQWGKTEEERYFYFGGIDAFRLIINTDFSVPLTPEKLYMRSETVDFQRGEVESEKMNLYFDLWQWNMNVVPLLNEE